MRIERPKNVSTVDHLLTLVRSKCPTPARGFTFVGVVLNVQFSVHWRLLNRGTHRCSPTSFGFLKAAHCFIDVYKYANESGQDDCKNTPSSAAEIRKLRSERRAEALNKLRTERSAFVCCTFLTIIFNVRTLL